MNGVAVPGRVAARCVAVIAVTAVVAGCAAGDEAGSDDGEFPAASRECEAEVDQILAGWQASIDEVGRRNVESFLRGERVYNLTDVPLGGDGCAALEATTIALDRAGRLEAPNPSAAWARGIILADLGEMAFFGPGLDPDAPVRERVDRPRPDLDVLTGEAPGADATCERNAEHVIAVYQASIDVTSSVGLDALLADPPPDEVADLEVLTELGADAVRVVQDGRCEEPEFSLALAERWPELEADGVSGNLALGALTDEVYGELHDQFRPDD